MNTPILLIYCAVIVASFALSAVLTPIIRRFAIKYSIVDRPETAVRKIHSAPVPFLGGTAIFLSTIIVIVLARYFGISDWSDIPLSLFIGIIIASAVIIIGGALDDKYNLKPIQQIIFPIIASIIVIGFGLHIAYITNPLGNAGSVIFIAKAIGIVIAFVWLLGMMYTTKFLDGLDGLVSGISAIASLFIFLASLRWDAPLSATGIWALALMGASLGFLIYNYEPAKIFLGEGGSVFIGFTLAVLSIISGSKIITTLLVMGIPILDVLWVVARRLIKHQSPFSGDRQHLHYRLLSLGLTKKQAVWLLYFIALGFGSLGFISSSYGKMILVFCLVAVMIIFSTLLRVKSKI